MVKFLKENKDFKNDYFVSCDFSGYDGTISAELKNIIEVPMVEIIYEHIKPTLIG